MSDLLHQPYRGKLISGLNQAPAMDHEGLSGIALSGSTVIAFADSHADEIGAAIAERFQSFGLSALSRLLKADNAGLMVEIL